MATSQLHPISCFHLALTLLCLNLSLVISLGYSSNTSEWHSGTATWYGRVNGDGTDGGACGYGSLQNTPYGLTVAAGSPVLFQNGKGCGACYQIRCVHNTACSDDPVTVVITDECPGGYCSGGNIHFDLSGTAFSHMANSGQTSSLLNAGVLPVMFKREQCTYATNIEFQVGQGSTDYWLEVLVKYEADDGDLSAVEAIQPGWSSWHAMNQVWGASWCLTEGPLHGPFSLRLTSSSGKSLTAYNAIPAHWQPGRMYASTVNF